MSRSAVIACCARSCAPHLPRALANIETIAAAYGDAAVVFVENDSEDETAQILARWCETRPGAQLIRLPGLSARIPARTERLAACRNACMDAIAGSPMKARDHLWVIDADEVNERPLDGADVARARDWLDQHADAAAVFCNATPIYYDILALRHPDWCPDDYWAEVRRRGPGLGKAEAQKRYCFDRQIPIPRDGEPIEVVSAFGGLGLYRLRDALQARYVGRDGEGQETCEHVAFNREVAAASGGRLWILPWLETGRTTGLGVPLPDAGKVELEQGGGRCTLHAPSDHRLGRFRARHPLYDRRLPVLARLLGEAAPDAAILDVGANIGDSAALCRLEGCRSRILAIEASLTYLKFLLLNRIKRPAVFAGVEPVWSLVGTDPDAAIELHDGTARAAVAGRDGARFERAPLASLQQIAARAGVQDVGLVKVDTDGQDQAIVLAELDWLKAARPVLWLETDIAAKADETDWARILTEGAADWPFLVAFDNFGFAVAAGPTAEKAPACLELIAYARRHKAAPAAAFGAPTVYYLDLALFPARFEAVYRSFLAELPELDL